MPYTKGAVARRVSFDIAAFLADLAQDSAYDGQIVHRRSLPSRAARYALLNPPLPEVLRRRLAATGITRLYVHQVMSTLRACDNNIDTAAEYLGVAPRQVRAALDYYAEFADDVDQDAAIAQRVATDERARWDRQQRALA